MATAAQRRIANFIPLVPAALAIVIVFVLTVVASQAAQVPQFNVVHYFSGQDGWQPGTGLTMDRGGNLYGTTWDGGAPACGTVFRLARKNSGWVLAPLYRFSGGNDGCLPSARVIIGPNGSLYGVTFGGGGSGCGGIGCGTVFNLRPSASACKTALCPWVETVLYRFTGGSDGAAPNGDLVFDQAGNLYGTASAGGLGGCDNDGSNGCGTVFELTPSGSGWIESVLYSFTGGNDGANPASGVIFDKAGNLDGITEMGGAEQCGTVFQLASAGNGWVESTLHVLQYLTDGCGSNGGVILDANGNLYGTTGSGGPYMNGGTVFEMTPSDGNWTFTLLYAFNGGLGPSDTPTLDAAGNLYGPTFEDGMYGQGLVFKLTPGSPWTFSSLHDFTGGSDGGNPTGSVIFDASGNLYGTTEDGGEGCDPNGCGVVFEITP